jgi:uncharacterized protein YbjT (DUF2867 family)
MRIAVIGATGNIGRLAVAALKRDGHDPVEVSRSKGVDVSTGDGLDAALEGVDAVIDVTNTAAQDEAEVVQFFTTATDHLLAAGRRAGVRHHVLLSIVNVDGVSDNAHYAGKVAQESRVTSGDVPWSIVRATHFHDFAAMVAGWAEQDGAATIAPLLVQPIAPADVADILAEVATGEAQGRVRDVAGPQTEDLVDMARRTFAVRGQQIRLVPTWDGMFSPAMAGKVLLPAEDARLAPTTFDEWLAAGAK